MVKSGTIKTGRLLIEPFSHKHLTEKYVSWLNNPEVVRFSEQKFRRHSMESCKSYLESFEQTPNYFWAIRTLDNELGHIGNITAHIDKMNKRADIGILIGETRAWGKGYASEAFRAVCDYLFKKTKIRKITAGTLAANERMVGLMKKVGMADDGHRIKQCIWDGKESDVVYGALFRKITKL